MSLMPTVSAELFGVVCKVTLGDIVGTLFTGTAAGSLPSAPIGGFLFDITNNHTASIAVAGVCLLLGSLVLLPLAQGPSHPSPLHKSSACSDAMNVDPDQRYTAELFAMVQEHCIL